MDTIVFTPTTRTMELSQAQVCHEVLSQERNVVLHVTPTDLRRTFLDKLKEIDFLFLVDFAIRQNSKSKKKACIQSWRNKPTLCYCYSVQFSFAWIIALQKVSLKVLGNQFVWEGGYF